VLREREWGQLDLVPAAQRLADFNGEISRAAAPPPPSFPDITDARRLRRWFVFLLTSRRVRCCSSSWRRPALVRRQRLFHLRIRTYIETIELPGDDSSSRRRPWSDAPCAVLSNSSSMSMYSQI
jgi:hypothetical protein